ncbi:Heme oxygenase [Catalinimonas alkaloidigena]|uniref:Heme oxygenase n=2 Tax=Catalinimonas alkaloidigena TaxID=1075417 RepID=A0A1G9Q485_9BACT|nr:Heme oxygenase [Catalinimonas alkaloidigena]
MHAFYTSLYLQSSNFTSASFHLPIEDHVNALHKEIKQFHIPHQQESYRCPECKDEADLLGISYVLEGSRLGGAVIRKMIRKQAWYHTDLDFFYLQGSSETLGAGWRNFLEVLENTTLTAEQEIRLQMAAINTFLCLEHLMNHLRKSAMVPVPVPNKAS